MQSIPPVLSARYFLSLPAKYRGILFCRVVGEHFVFTLPSFLKFALVAGPIDYIHVLDTASTSAQSGVPLH